MATTNRVKMGLDIEVSQASLASLKQVLQKVQTEAKKASFQGDLTQGLKAASKEAEKLQAILVQSWNGKIGQLDLNKFNAEIEKNYKTIGNLKRAFEQGGRTGAEAYNKIAQAVLTTNIQLKESNKLLDKMAVTMANTVRFGISSSVFNNLTNSISEAWGYVQKLDTSLNNIRIVTGKSGEEMRKFAKEANIAAKGIGANTKSYTDASLIYYQQGLKDAEVKARAETTLKTANVTGQHADAVSEQLTAVWNGYKVNAQETEKYVDKLAAVAASTASDLEELSVGMSKVAAAANIMGVDVDQLNAQLATIVSVTRQAPESVGTALKTIYARLGDIKADLNGEVSLDEYTKKMAEMGINVLDANRNLRDTGEVIEEVGSKWGDMTREQRVALSQIMAGTRQYNNLLTLFDNWDMYTKALETSKNSTGELQKQQDIYAESVKAHLQMLKTESEKTWDIFFDEDQAKSFIDILTGGLGLVNNYLEGFGGGLRTISQLALQASTVFSKQMGKGLQTTFQNKANKEMNSKTFLAKNLWKDEGVASADTQLPSSIALEEQIEYYEKIKNVQDSLTESEAKESMEHLKKIGELTEKIEYAERYADITREALKLNKNEEVSEDTIKKGLSKSNEELDKKQSKIQEIKKLVETYNKNREDQGEGYLIDDKEKDLVEELKTAVEYRKTISDKDDLDPEMYEQYEKESLRIEEVKAKLKKGMALEEEDVLLILKGHVQERKEELDKASLLKKALEGCKLTEEEIIELRKSKEDYAKLLAQLEERKQKELEISQIIESYSIILSSINAMAGALSTLFNPEIDGWEKFKTIVLVVGSQIVTIATHMDSIKKTFENTQKFMKGFKEGFKEIATKHLSTKATKENTQAQKENNKEKMQGNLISQQTQKNNIKEAVTEAGSTASNVAPIAGGIASKGAGATAGGATVTGGSAAAGGGAAALGATAATAATVIAVVGAIVAIGYVAYKAWNKAKDEAIAARKAAKEAQEEAEKAEEKRSDFKNQINSLKQLRKELKEIDRDTDAWNEKILEINQNVLNLLDKFPQLAQYLEMDGTGAFTISDENLQNFQKELYEKALKAQGTAITSKRLSIEADAEESRVNEQRAISNDSYLGMSTEDYKDLLSRVQGDENFFKNGELDKWVQNLYQNVEASDREVAINSLKKAILKNETTIRKNILALEKSTQAIEKQKEIEVSNHLNTYGSDDYKNSKYKAIISQGVKEKTDDLNDKAKEKYKDKWGGMSDKEIQKKYAELKGYKNSHDKFGNKGEYTDYDGKTHVIDDKIAREELALHEVLEGEKGKKITRETISNLSNFEKTILKQSNLSQEESADFIYKLQKGKNFTPEDFSQEEIALLENLIKTGEWQKYYKDFGYETGSSYQDALTNLNNSPTAGGSTEKLLRGVKNYKDNFKSIKEKQKTSLVESGYSESLNSLAEEYEKGSLNSSNIDKNEDYKKVLGQLQKIKDIYPDLTQQAEIFSNKTLVGTSEWENSLYDLNIALSQLKIEETQKKWDETFKNIDKEAEKEGIQIDINDKNFKEEMDALLDADYSVTVSVQSQLDGEFDQVFDGMQDIDAAVKKIQDGWRVSKEDIVQLGEVIPGLVDNYSIAADGMIQLDEATARSAIRAAQTRMDASKEETIADLTNAEKAYTTKAIVYENMSIAAQKASENKITSEEAASVVSEGIEKINQENNNLTAINAQENSQDTVTQGIQNTQHLMDADADWAEQAIKNAKAVAKAKSAAMNGDVEGTNQEVTRGTTEVKKEGVKTENKTETSDSKPEDFKDKTKEQWEELATFYAGLAEQNRTAASKITAEIAALKAGSNALKHEMGGKSGRGSGSKKEAQRLENLDKELDIYHDINIELKKVSTLLDQIESQEGKLTGKELLENLNQQVSLLNKRIDLTKTKMEIARGEAQRLRDQLSKAGILFADDGTVSNYEAAYQQQLKYVNGIIDTYNSMTAEEQEKYKDTVEQAKKDFENFEKNLKDYESVIHETIPELQQDIQQAIDKQIELKIKSFNMEIELRLDLAEAQKDWNKFKREIIDNIKDEDILGIAKSQLNDFFIYYDEKNQGVIQKNAEHLKNVLKEIKQLDAEGFSSVYGDNKNQALEDLQKYYQELKNSLEEIQNLEEQIHDSYLSKMDEINGKLKEQKSSFELISNVIKHDMNLISLLKGEESYEDLEKYFEKQNDNYQNQLDFERQQVDFWKAEMKAAEENSEEWKKAKENWVSAINDLNSTIEASIENLQKKYTNAIEKIFKALNDKVSNGKGLNYIEEEWSLINKNAEQYLDTINAAFGIQELENKYLDAIDGTDNLETQKKLNELKEQEIKALKEQDKLTQYDIDRANLKYEIALKQIALEEAQKNKTSMRLRRDSQGNYSYQFVADQDEIGRLQDELSKLQNDLYNFDKDRYKENLDQLYSEWVEYQNKMKEAAQINDPQLRAERELLIKEQYGELINGIVDQNEQIQKNLQESAFIDLSLIYEKNLQDFQNMTESEKDLVMNDLVPQWKSGVQEMADAIAGEGGFFPTCKESFEQLEQETQKYEDELKKLEDSAKVNFDEINKGIDSTIDQSKELLKENDKLIDGFGKELDAIQAVIDELDSLAKKYSEAKKEALEATEAAYKYWQEQQRQSADAANKNTQANSGSSNSGSSQSNSSSSSTGQGSSSSSSSISKNGGDGKLTVGDRATYNGRYYYDSYGTSPVGSRYSGVPRGIIVDILNNNPYGVHIKSADGRFGDLGWIRRSQLTGYDTGGYTGNWHNKDGKIALLHQKELILNEKDTSNILNAVSILRSVGSTMLDRIGKMSSLTSDNIGARERQTLEQDVHIEAHFPNVQSSQDIEMAFDNLINIASQKAGYRG